MLTQAVSVCVAERITRLLMPPVLILQTMLRRHVNPATCLIRHQVGHVVDINLNYLNCAIHYSNSNLRDYFYLTANGIDL